MKNQTQLHSASRRRPFLGIAALLLAVGAGGVLTMLSLRSAPPAPAISQGTAAPTEVVRARQLAYDVVRSYPHNRDAFTQGLLWHNGFLYESTGLEGQSTLRRVDLKTGRVVQSIRLPADVFGEGLALVGERLIQLTWQSQRAFVWDRATFKPVGEWHYEGEGWGLTYDGRHLIMSNGSDVLTFRDPNTFRPVRQLRVTLDGRPLTELNELAWIEGEVWANVWKTDTIVRINPQTGHVTSFLDLTGILPRQQRSGQEDVLNGIAYDAAQQRIFVTGKLWPRLFEIRVREK